MRSTLAWQSAWKAGGAPPVPPLPSPTLDAAYAKCGEITADYAKTFYLVSGGGGRGRAARGARDEERRTRGARGTKGERARP